MRLEDSKITESELDFYLEEAAKGIEYSGTGATGIMGRVIGVVLKAHVVTPELRARAHKSLKDQEEGTEVPNSI